MDKKKVMHNVNDIKIGDVWGYLSKIISVFSPAKSLFSPKFFGKRLSSPKFLESFFSLDKKRTSQKFKKKLAQSLFAAAILTGSIWCGIINPCWAVTTVTVNGSTGLNFTLKFHDKDEAYGRHATAGDDISPAQQNAVINVFQYYADTFGTLPTGVPTTIDIGIHSIGGSALAHASGSFVCLDPRLTNSPYRYGLVRPTQIGGSVSAFFPVIEHEFTHILGMVYSGTMTNFLGTLNEYTKLLSDGTNIAQPNWQWNDPNGTNYFNATGESVVFTGKNVRRVYGDLADNATDADISAKGVSIPVFSSTTFSSGSSLSHLSTPHGVLNTGVVPEYTRPFFSEVELALLADIGANINLNDHFGRSIYQEYTGTTITNNQGFNSTKTYGVGLHAVSGGNNIIQKADLYSNGYAGAGIRIEGNDNKVTIDSGVNVKANGEDGIGVLTIWGTGTNLVNRGTIEANGIRGCGVWLKNDDTNFGNVMILDNRGTIRANGEGGTGIIIETNNARNVFVNRGTIEAKGANGRGIWVNSSLANFNNSGTIDVGTENDAFYIGSAVSLNFMKGTSVIGNITNNSDTEINLTFGKQADVNGVATDNGDDTDFAIDIAGNIIVGRGGFNLLTWGGETTLSAGSLSFRYVTIGADPNNIKSTLNLPGNVHFYYLGLGGTNNTSSVLDGKTSGIVNITTDVTNRITVQNFATFQTESASLINTTSGKIVNNTNIIVDKKLTNDGLIDTAQLVDVKSGDIDNSGVIQKVTTLQTVANLNNKGIVAQIIDNKTVNVGNDLTNDGLIDRFTTLTVGRDVINNSNINISRDSTVTIGRNGFNNGYSTINGSLEAGNQFTNQLTELIAGAGTVITKNGFINNGIVSPGNSIDTFTVVGPFVNNETGIFLIEIDPSHYPGKPFAGLHNDLVNVKAGIATINGGDIYTASLSNDKTKTATPARYVGNTHYTFLDTDKADDLVVNNVLTVHDPADVLLFDFLADYDTKSYWLDVQREYYYGKFGDTFNQIVVGGYIDEISLDPNPLGDFFDVLVTLDKLNGGIAHRGGISKAAKFSLDQISGAVYATIANAGIQNTTIVNNSLADVLRRNIFSVQTDCNPCETICTTKISSKHNTWGLGYGIGGETQFDGNAYGYDQSFAGTLIGIDKTYKRNLRVGLFASYGEGRISSNLLERSKSKELLTGLYLRKGMNIGYILASGGLGNNRYDTQRTISFVDRKTENEHDAIVGTVYLERDLEFKRRYGIFQTFFGLQYVGSQQNGFTEQGADSLNLTAASIEGHSLRSLLGNRFNTNARTFNKGKLSLYGNAIWMHEFLRSYTNFTAEFSNPGLTNFSSVAKFTVRGNDSKRDWAILGVGLNYDKNRARLFGGYGTYANGQQILHTGNIGLVYGW